MIRPFEISKAPLEQQRLWNFYQETFPARTFMPNRPQFEFIKAVGELVPEGINTFFMSSANGVGKSTGVFNMLINIIFGNVSIYQNVYDMESDKEYASFYDFPLYTAFPRDWPKTIWFVSNRDSIEYLHAEFKRWLPANKYSESYTESKLGKAHPAKMTFQGGWEMFYKTTDQDIENFESANVAIVIFDEPPSHEIYKACIFRLRRGGFMAIAATPLFGAGWLLDTVVESKELWNGVSGTKWYSRYPVFENCIETTGNWRLGVYGVHPKGNLPKRQVDMLIAEADPTEAEARIYGKMMHLSGLIFKVFDRDIHVQPVLNKDIPDKYNYRMTIDPHDRRPPAVIWERIDQYGIREVIREWPAHEDWFNTRYVDIKDAGRRTIEDFIREWIKIEDSLGIHKDNIQRLIDPNFSQAPVRSTGRTVVEDYTVTSRLAGKEMIFITKINNEIFAGHRAVEGLLSLDLHEQPGITIDPSCENLILAFARYAYRDHRGKDAEENKGLSDMVKEKYKDFIDCVRYSAMIPWKYSPFLVRDRILQKKDYNPERIEQTIPEGAY